MKNKVEQYWFLCEICNSICPQISSKHNSAVCICSGKEVKMTLHKEFDFEIQVNKYYNKVVNERYSRR